MDTYGLICQFVGSCFIGYKATHVINWAIQRTRTAWRKRTMKINPYDLPSSPQALEHLAAHLKTNVEVLGVRLKKRHDAQRKKVKLRKTAKILLLQSGKLVATYNSYLPAFKYVRVWDNDVVNESPQAFKEFLLELKDLNIQPQQIWELESPNGIINLTQAICITWPELQREIFAGTKYENKIPRQSTANFLYDGNWVAARNPGYY